MFSSFGQPSAIWESQSSSSDAAAYSDPFSNMLFVSKATGTTRTGVLQQLMEEKFPIDYLSPFLHEATHHRCFDSTVGFALLGVEGFSRSAWWEKYRCCKDDVNDIDECKANPLCYNRALVRELLHFFSPFLEGLALYGELNAVPGQAPAASTMLLNAENLFFLHRKNAVSKSRLGSADLYDSIAGVFSEQRDKGKAFIRTKALINNERDQGWKQPYILGYAWIQKLIEDFFVANPQARDDKDASLAFICSFIFDDFQLACLIIRASYRILSLEPPATTEPIYEYLFERLKLLVHPDIGAFYKEFILKMVMNSREPCSYYNAHPHLSQELYYTVAQSSITELKWSMPNISKYRYMLRFCVMHADGMILDAEQETMTCTLDGVKITLPGLIDGFPMGDEPEARAATLLENSIECFLVNFNVYIVFFFKGNIVAITDRYMTPIPPAIAEQVFGDLPSFYHIEYWRLKYWELLNPAKGTSCRNYLDKRLEIAKSWIKRIYVV